MVPIRLPALLLALLIAPPVLAQAAATPELHHPITLSEGYRPLPSDNLASLVIGMSVFSSASDTAELVGSIDDLVVGADGRLAAVVLSVGDYAGTGEKSIAVDYSQLQWTKGPDGADRIVLNATKESLAAAPAFNWREDLSQAHADVATQDAEAETLAPNANDTSNVSPDQTTDMPAGEHVDRSTLSPIDASALTAADLQGISVFGQDDELIGTIGDFVLNADGKVDAVIVDVGGFLGIGQKPVAVGFENLSFSVDSNNQRYLFLNASKEQLENQPPFDKQTYPAARATQRLVVEP